MYLYWIIKCNIVALIIWLTQVDLEISKSFVYSEQTFNICGKICTWRDKMYFFLNIPIHAVGKPLHVPLAWHFLVDDPCRINPGSQSNSTLLGNTVGSPEKEPFMGTEKGPQSTAKKKTFQRNFWNLLQIWTGRFQNRLRLYNLVKCHFE